MKIVIKRYIFNGHNTIGRMYIDGAFFAHCLEDEYRAINKPEDKVKGQTAIPYGVYDTIVTQSARFKRELPELLNVPYFDKIRIHGGNTEADSEGCILIGASTDEKKIWNCKDKVNELTAKIKAAGKVAVSIEKEFM